MTGGPQPARARPASTTAARLSWPAAVENAPSVRIQPSRWQREPRQISEQSGNLCALSAQREDGAGGFANDVMRRRAEEPNVERTHPVHAHHNEFHVLRRRDRQDLAI